jgi:GxxExxY protein
VHRHLGPGLLESVYEECFARELTLRGIPFRRQALLPIVYKGETVGEHFKVDFLDYEEIAVELKAVETVHPIYKAQLVTYLRLSGRRVGLLINFNELTLMKGVHRRVL